MKRTKKTTPASSGKEKVRELIQRQAEAASPKSTPVSTDSPVTNESTQPTPPSGPATLVEESKPLDGSIRIDGMSFEEQAQIVLNPLAGLNQKQIVASPKDKAKDPFAPSSFVVVGKKK